MRRRIVFTTQFPEYPFARMPDPVRPYGGRNRREISHYAHQLRQQMAPPWRACPIRPRQRANANAKSSSNFNACIGTYVLRLLDFWPYLACFAPPEKLPRKSPELTPKIFRANRNLGSSKRTCLGFEPSSTCLEGGSCTTELSNPLYHLLLVRP